MTRQHTRPVVLVGVDGTEDGTRALRYAVREARRIDGVLRIVHVQQQAVVLAPMLPLVPDPTLHEVASGVLKHAEEQARSFGYDDPELEAVVLQGPRHSALVDESRGAACVVVGRHGSALQHLMAGSTSAALGAHAACPVICVPPTWNPTVEQGLVVAGVDGSFGADRVVDAALEAARCRRARLEVLHAWRPVGQYDVAIGSRTLARDWRHGTQTSLTRWMHERHPGVDVEWTIEPRYQRATVALHDASQKADLLVVGRHGHGAPHALALGSTARAMLRVSECPVLVVPTPKHAAHHDQPADAG